jgi:hypothetical protein
MKKLFISLCLFLAISSVYAVTFVPDPNKVYNIVQSSSNNVFGASGTSPVLSDKQDLASQAFKFVSTGVTDTTYFLKNGSNMYLNRIKGNGYDTNYDAVTKGDSSKWVIVGADATGFRLKNVSTQKYLAANVTSYGSNLYCDKGATDGNGLYKLQEATIYTGTPSTVYKETFSAAGVDGTDGAIWTGAPSTLAGANPSKWPGGIDLQTTGDGNMTLVSQWWNLTLKLTTADAAVIIPDINVAGYTNLQFSIDGYREGGSLAPILDVKVGTGAWVSQATQGVGNYWNWTTAVTSIKDASGIQLSNVSKISLRISSNESGTTKYYLDNVKILGRPSVTTSLSSELKEVFSVYPNPATNYILTKNAQKVTITDLNGRLVKEAFNTERVDVSSLAKGAYLVKVNVSGSIQVGKLLKK